MAVPRKLYCYLIFTLILCIHTNAENETVKKECPIVQHGSGLMEDEDCNKDLAWSDTDLFSAPNTTAEVTTTTEESTSSETTTPTAATTETTTNETTTTEATTTTEESTTSETTTPTPATTETTTNETTTTTEESTSSETTTPTAATTETTTNEITTTTEESMSSEATTPTAATTETTTNETTTTTEESTSSEATTPTAATTETTTNETTTTEAITTTEESTSSETTTPTAASTETTTNETTTTTEESTSSETTTPTVPTTETTTNEITTTTEESTSSETTTPMAATTETTTNETTTTTEESTSSETTTPTAATTETTTNDTTTTEATTITEESTTSETTTPTMASTETTTNETTTTTEESTSSETTIPPAATTETTTNEITTTTEESTSSEATTPTAATTETTTNEITTTTEESTSSEATTPTAATTETTTNETTTTTEESTSSEATTPTAATTETTTNEITTTTEESTSSEATTPTAATTETTTNEITTTTEESTSSEATTPTAATTETTTNETTTTTEESTSSEATTPTAATTETTTNETTTTTEESTSSEATTPTAATTETTTNETTTTEAITTTEESTSSETTTPTAASTETTTNETTTTTEESTSSETTTPTAATTETTTNEITTTTEESTSSEATTPTAATTETTTNETTTTTEESTSSEATTPTPATTETTTNETTTTTEESTSSEATTPTAATTEATTNEITTTTEESTSSETTTPTAATTETTTNETTTTEATTTTEESTTSETTTPTAATTETTTNETTTTTEESTSSETTTPTVTSTETTTDETTTTEATTADTTTAISTTPGISPDDIIDQIIEDILDILENEDVPVYVDTITDAFDQVNDLLDMEEDVTFPPEMLDILDTLGSRIDLNGALNDTIVRDNLALLMADASPDNPVRGLRLTAGGEGRTRTSFSKDTFEFLSDDDPDHLNADASDAVVHLPESVATSTRRISFVVFRDDQAFANTNSRLAVNSRVISVNVENLTQFDNDVVVKLHLKPVIETTGDMNRSCVFWNLEDGSGYWSDRGCKLVKSTDPGVLDACHCNHLTHFAEVIVLPPPDTTTVEPSETSTGTTSATSSPETDLEQILEDLENLLNTTDQIYIDQAEPIFDQIDRHLSIGEEVFPARILHLLDVLGSRIYVQDFETDRLIRNNIALMVADADPDSNPVRGLTIESENDGFMGKQLDFLRDEVNAAILDSDIHEVVVNLAPSLLSTRRHISFVVLYNGNAFPREDEFTINSRVVSVNIMDLPQTRNGELVDIHLSPLQLPEQDRRRSCGHWEYQEDSTGYWSQEGCTFITSDNPTVLDTCRCDRIGRFAQIVTSQPTFSKSNENALQAITLTGSSLSIIGAIFIVITALLFRSWRLTFRNQVWVQLSIALFILSVCFIVTASVRYVEYSVSCLLTGIFMHYSVLASFCWILVVAVIAYRDLVIISRHENTRNMTVASSFSWGVPVVLMMIYALAAEEPYAMLFAEMTPSGSFCYPSGLGLWLSVYTPIGVILLANVILFFYIVGYISRSVYIPNEENAKKAIKSSRIGFGLVILFSLAWVFGIFASNIVTAYLFTITVTIQCFILFIFVVCGDKDTRDLWLHKLKFKSDSTHNSQHSRHLTSSFY